RQVDGLIIASVQPLSRVELFERIRTRKVPFILIDRPIEGVNASFVGADNRSIGKLATEHLIEQGCRCVAHLRGPEIGIAAERMLRPKRVLIPPRLVVRKSTQRQAESPIISLSGAAFRESTLEEKET